MTTNRPQSLLKDKPLWLLAGGLLLVAGLSFVGVRSLIQARQANLAEDVEPLPQRVQVAALGRVEPAGRVVDVVPSEHRRLSRNDVPERDSLLAYHILA